MDKLYSSCCDVDAAVIEMELFSKSINHNVIYTFICLSISNKNYNDSASKLVGNT